MPNSEDDIFERIVLGQSWAVDEPAIIEEVENHRRHHFSVEIEMLFRATEITRHWLLQLAEIHSDDQDDHHEDLMSHTAEVLKRVLVNAAKAIEEDPQALEWLHEHKPEIAEEILNGHYENI